MVHTYVVSVLACIPGNITFQAVFPIQGFLFRFLKTFEGLSFWFDCVFTTIVAQ